MSVQSFKWVEGRGVILRETQGRGSKQAALEACKWRLAAAPMGALEDTLHQKTASF